VLSDVPGLVVASHVLSPIVFLKLKKSTGSDKTDMHLLESIAKQVCFIRNLIACSVPFPIKHIKVEVANRLVKSGSG
jgi:hypothetical protein